MIRNINGNDTIKIKTFVQYINTITKNKAKKKKILEIRFTELFFLKNDILSNNPIFILT